MREISGRHEYRLQSTMGITEIERMQEILINREFVELFKILKFESLASSGGEAKILIADVKVEVNGEVETRKRRKIIAGDVIKVFDDEYRVVAA